MKCRGINFHGIISCILLGICYTVTEVIWLSRLTELIQKYKRIVLYMFFGILTTAVNYAVCFFLLYRVEFTAALSNAVAWFVSVLFAFFTNKPFVFESNDWSWKNVGHEMFDFFACRILTGVLETVTLSILVDTMGLNGFIWKLIVSIIVVVLNYIGSKLFAFRKK